VQPHDETRQVVATLVANHRRFLSFLERRVGDRGVILRLRSLVASGDFAEYWRFHLGQEKLVNHAMNYADEPPSLPLPTAVGAPRSRARPPHLRVVK
jgi:hypothetical protein